MNLPELADIYTLHKRSSYYTFSRANKDFDKATTNKTKYHFSKFVLLNLPDWNDSSMYFKFRKSTSTIDPGDLLNYYENAGDFPELESIYYVNPNMVIPRLIRYYMENIIREEQITDPRIAEIAFFKLLEYMNVSDPLSVIKYIGDISTSFFNELSPNLGYMEIVCSLPNICPLFKDAAFETKTLSLGAATAYNTHALYDSQNPFNFDLSSCKNIDFTKGVYDDITKSTFDFNAILLYYIDEDNIKKLHGINFITPFQLSAGNYTLDKLSHQTNVAQTFGYNFIFNMKSNCNNATREEIFMMNDGTFWRIFDDTLGKLNSFLEKEIR